MSSRGHWNGKLLKGLALQQWRQCLYVQTGQAKGKILGAVIAKLTQNPGFDLAHCCPAPLQSSQERVAGPDPTA